MTVMATSACSAYRDEILRHFVDGTALSAGAREHYVGCVHCMTEATAVLNREMGSLPEHSTLPEPALQALKHGRDVLQREFGIRSRSALGQSE